MVSASDVTWLKMRPLENCARADGVRKRICQGKPPSLQQEKRAFSAPVPKIMHIGDLHSHV